LNPAARSRSRAVRRPIAKAMAAALVVLAVAGSGRAEDAIGAALANPAHPSETIVATAPGVATTAPAQPTQPPAAAPSAGMSQPNIDQGEISPDGPPNETALAYEARLRASVAAAQAFQGPLDGRWTLYGEDGKALYVFMFTDPPNGRGPLEAAWRDPGKIRGMDDLGVVDVVNREGPALTLSFYPRAGSAVTRIQLQAGANGGFAGRMDQAGAVRTVSLRR
jgi:hypothetical protein